MNLIIFPKIINNFITNFDKILSYTNHTLFENNIVSSNTYNIKSKILNKNIINDDLYEIKNILLKNNIT